MARAKGSRAQVAVGFETTYGTPPAAGKFWRMPFSREDVGGTRGLLASNLLGYGRDEQDPVLDGQVVDGGATIPVDKRALGVWLKGLLGAPTTTGTGPYTHVFKSGAQVLPSMSIEIGMPEVPSFAMNKGARVNTLGIEMRPRGLIDATVAVLAKGEVKAPTTAIGTPVDFEVERFSSFTGSVKRDGGVLANVVGASFNYSNNLEGVETIRDDGEVEDIDPGMSQLRGSITVRYASRDLMDLAEAATPIELELGYRVSASEAFTLVAHRVFLPKPKVSIDGPGGIQAEYQWQASRDATEGVAATFTLVNDISNYSL
ncbi:phage tail tube protein [Limimaricola pyoseonensis]|uniref:Phage tail tube protein n=1 Tax=Limimaricola pyoseonensis TaxID=521013 RepID=A0A1G7GQ31_9RHOB|nr:phage tail tube protein [Limimaricola pyoseonensis]SDE90163.1 hypothetical protein SAMN04488567_2874 [Limimaricola pyoseonensis]